MACKTGRSVCVKRGPHPPTLPTVEHEIRAQMLAQDEALVLETKRQMEEELFTGGDKVTGDS